MDPPRSFWPCQRGVTWWHQRSGRGGERESEHLDPPCGPVWDQGCASNRPLRGWRPTLRPIRSPRGPAQTSACRSVRGFPGAPHWVLRERTTRWGRIFVRWMRVTAAISTAQAGNRSTSRRHWVPREGSGVTGLEQSWRGLDVQRVASWERAEIEERVGGV